jgi:hypothetical protein
MSKYEPLEKFLARSASGELAMRFSEIEHIIGAELPPVAFKHRAWWSNNPSNSVITHAWLKAGYKTERVDMGAQRLVFRRNTEANGSGPSASPTLGPGGAVARLRHALGGTVRVAPGVDLTHPVGDAWNAAS